MTSFSFENVPVGALVRGARGARTPINAVDPQLIVHSSRLTVKSGRAGSPAILRGAVRRRSEEKSALNHQHKMAIFTSC